VSAARARTPSTSAAENLTRPEGMAASRLLALDGAGLTMAPLESR